MLANAPPPTFKHRADYLRMARHGKKLARPGFVMQLACGEPGSPLTAGYTATKKIGNAVARNRARRRLKEAARITLAGMALTGVEIVLICRQDTAKLPFAQLCSGLKSALADSLK